MIGGTAEPGPSEPSDPSYGYGFIARLATSGELDVSFGDDGSTLLDVGQYAYSPAAAMSGIARLSSGAIAAAMSADDFYSDYSDDWSIVIARLAPSGGNSGVLGLARVEVRATEGTDARVVVRRTGGASGAVGIEYWTTCTGWGGCFDTADAGYDYDPTSGTLTWADGDASDRTVTIPIVADYMVEEDESFDFYLENVTGGARLATSYGWVTITTDVNEEIDDNPGTLSFIGEGYVREDSTSGALLLVRRTDGRTGALSVDYFTTPISARAGLDFIWSTGTLYWADGDVGVKTITIPIVNDGSPEGDERFLVTLSAPLGGATLGFPPFMQVMIEDEDPSVGGGGGSGPFETLLLGLLFLASLAARVARGRRARGFVVRYRCLDDELGRVGIGDTELGNGLDARRPSDVTSFTLRSAICQSRRHRRFAVDAPRPAFPGSTGGVDVPAPAPGKNRSFSHQWIRTRTWVNQAR